MTSTKYSLNDLIYLMSRLRDPNDGCPWDLDQSYETIVPSTIEEAYEVADTIEKGNYDGLREELGDLLFQTVFYSQLAAEEGRFTLLDVISGLVEKLVRRHPHVFPDGTLASRIGDISSGDIESSTDVKKQWEEIKVGERKNKGQQSLMDDVPSGFPALLRAHKLQKRAARVGFDWHEDEGVFEKLEEEIEEVKHALSSNNSAATEDELGDLLFTCVNLVRRLGFDSETALRKASSKFERRFRLMENQVIEYQQFKANRKQTDSEGILHIETDRLLKDMTADQLEALWLEAKRREHLA